MRLKAILELWHRIGLRYRLAGAYTLIFGLTLIFFCFTVFREFMDVHQKAFDAALYNHAVDVSEGVNVGLFGDLSLQTDIVEEGAKLFPFSLGQSFLEVRDLDGEIIGRSQSLGDSELPFNAELAQSILRRKSAFFQSVDLRGFPGVGERDYLFRMITYILHRPGGQHLFLQIAVPRILLERDRKSLLMVFFIGTPLILLVALLTGLFLSQRALRPVHEITAIVRSIGVSSLTERVPVPRPQDELRELAQTFNGLLDRLERAFEAQERFIADASHQLKTPLSILRGELDVLTSRSRSAEELRQFINSASHEINHLIRMTEDLLIMARIDAGQQSLFMGKIQLEEIILESMSRLERLAQQKGIRLQLNFADTFSEASGLEMPARGDADLTICMITNLIENAIKYSPRGGVVNIGASLVEDGSYLISVSDQGPGISDSNLPHIFERFYRGDQAHSGVAGTGLGLAIARQIAEAHSWTIAVHSKPGAGAEFYVRIKNI